LRPVALNLAALGGSLVYVAVGAIFSSRGVILYQKRIAGFYTYVSAFSPSRPVWGLLGGRPVGLAKFIRGLSRPLRPPRPAILVLALPHAIRQWTRAAQVGLVGVGNCVARLPFLIRSQSATTRVHYQRASATPSSKSRVSAQQGECNPMAAAIARPSGIGASANHSRPEKWSGTSSVSGPFPYRATIS